MKKRSVYIQLFLFLSLSFLINACAGVDKKAEAPSAGSYDSSIGSATEGGKTGTPPAAPSEAESAAPAPKPDSKALSKDRLAEASGKSGAPTSSAGGGAPTASGLKAGFSDDNAQFNYFLHFLKEYAYVPNYALDIAERLTLKVVDSSGKPVPNAHVEVRASKKRLDEGYTYADGTFRVYPLACGTTAALLEVKVDSEAGIAELSLARDGPRQVTVSLSKERSIPNPVPLDILFVLDTTGSMGEEIERLRDTIEIVHANILAMSPRPAVRFGMVLYKDREDEYVTEVVPFTSDLREFQESLDKVYASGGGDTPEDLQSALEDAIKRMDWNAKGIRLGFIITDAEAHLDYGQKYTYVSAARDAKSRAIKLHTIGTGGLSLEGEYVLRQISQYTEGKYIFLTYGETGESEGGSPGSVSHHTGSNFQTDKLEAIVIRFVKEELANLMDVSLETGEDYFEANRMEEEAKDATLDKLFTEALNSLVDYSTFQVGAETPCAVLPIVPADPSLASNAEYFGERLLLTAAKAKTFKLVERRSLQNVLDELELQLSGLADEKAAARTGELLGADVLISGTLYQKGDRYELFLRLIRTSTAEVLAVTRARIDGKLGL